MAGVLSAEERERIVAATRAAEALTRAEFATVVARESDQYWAVPTLAAAALALLLPGLTWLAGVEAGFGQIYAAQLVAFAGLLTLFRWRPVTLRLVPRAVQEARAANLARVTFVRLGLHRVPAQTGVLLFVSLAEHYVEVIADDGAHAAAPPGTWDAVVAAFTEEVRQGRTAEGFERALDRLGRALSGPLPRRPGDANALPDRLIEL